MRTSHAVALSLQGKGTEAVPEFEKVLQDDPKNLKALANLATALFTLQHYAQASDAFARAVELAPDDPDLRTNLGIALQKTGRAEEAKKAFADAQRLRTAAAHRP